MMEEVIIRMIIAHAGIIVDTDMEGMAADMLTNMDIAVMAIIGFTVIPADAGKFIIGRKQE